ncbi:hypothetical protein T484DRAFT_1768456 [Baffinella frigidus]|nr:hypothetical protein T484DRAFT_1768456 [Cryptophyta sp. CCMP2293]
MNTDRRGTGAAFRVLLFAAVLRSGAFPNALTLLARLGSPGPSGSACLNPARTPYCGVLTRSAVVGERFCGLPAGALQLRGALETESSCEDGAPIGLPPATVEPGARIRLPQYLHATLPDVFPSLSSARWAVRRKEIWVAGETNASRTDTNITGNPPHRGEEILVYPRGKQPGEKSGKANATDASRADSGRGGRF